MPLNSQRTQVFLSKQAIKRSLKTKLKLIGAENKILVDTINGYVKKAEAVYSKLENATDITPKQFSKAMNKLETVYSACVKLILMTTDLFDDDDKSESTSESSTKASVSMASVELPDSDHSGPEEIKHNAFRKETNKRMKKLESRFHDFVARKEMAAQGRKSPQSTKETLKNAQMVKQPTLSPKKIENLFRPDISGDLDNFIEFQRFMYGLKNASPQESQKAGGETLDLVEGKEITGVEALNRSIFEQPTNVLKKETSALSPPYREAEDIDLQNSIIKKLENLEMAIQRMSKCVQGNLYGTLADEETKPSGYAKSVINPCKSEERVSSPMRFSGQARHEEMSEMSSPTFSQHSRNAYGKSHCECCKNVLKAKVTRFEHACSTGAYHNTSQENLGKLGTSLNAPRRHPLHFCQCQYSSCIQDSEPTRQHQEEYYASNKHGSSTFLGSKQARDVNDIHSLNIAEYLAAAPNSSVAQANQDKNVALESRLSTKERDEMVNKIVEMVSAQLLPRLAGHEVGARNTEHQQDDASLSNGTHSNGHQIKRTRPLSAPNIKWPEGKHNVSSASFTRICDNVLTAFLQPKEDAAPPPQLDSGVLRRDQSTIPSQIQPHSITSQLFHSAINSQESVQQSQINTHTYHSIQQQMHDLRASLDDFNSKQHHQYKPNPAGGSSPLRSAIFESEEEHARQVINIPTVQAQSRNIDNAQQFRRSPLKSRGDNKLIEPFTIEIHDYQHVPRAKSSSSPDKHSSIERDKEHFRQHAKSFMHQMKAQENPISNFSPKDCDRTGAQFVRKYTCDRNKQALDSEENIDSEDSYKNKEADSLERHVHFHYSYPYEAAVETVLPKDKSCSISNLACRGNERVGCLLQMKVGSSAPQKSPQSNEARLADQQNMGATILACSGAKRQAQQDHSQYGDVRCGKLVDTILPCKEVDSRESDYASHEIYDVTNNLSQSKNQDGSKKTCIKSTKTICVSNLPLNLEEIRLLYLLKPHGHVTKIYFIKHRTTGAFQGIAYIKFSKEEDARSAATALHKSNIDGQTVYARIHTQGK